LRRYSSSICSEIPVFICIPFLVSVYSEVAHARDRTLTNTQRGQPHSPRTHRYNPQQLFL